MKSLPCDTTYLRRLFHNRAGYWIRLLSHHPTFCVLVTALACLAMIPGCAITRGLNGHFNHKPYRMDRNGKDESTAFAGTIEQLSERGEGQPVTLGYVEFDDQGELWRIANKEEMPTQLSHVLKDMEKQVQKGPIKTVVFIHGWRNDASPCNAKSGNLADFKNSLLELGKVCDTPVYGVYVAWRGGSFPTPHFAYWDVWDREAAAKRVGGPTMLTALRSISSMAHRNPASRVIMVGHSFGGKILTQATSHHLAGEIGRAVGSGEQNITPLADTVVVVNSATNGPEMRQVLKLMRDYKITYRRNGLDVPLFVTISSESDFWVRRGLPVYLRLNRDYIGFPERSGHVVNQTQNDNLYSAMGFNPSMIDYKLTKPDGGKLDYPAINWAGNKSAEALIRCNMENGGRANSSGVLVRLQTASQPNEVADFKIIPTKSKDKLSPYWGFTVPDFVVSGHSGLWQPNLLGLISVFEGMSKPPRRLATGATGQKSLLRLQKPL